MFLIVVVLDIPDKLRLWTRFDCNDSFLDCHNLLKAFFYTNTAHNITSKKET